MRNVTNGPFATIEPRINIKGEADGSRLHMKYPEYVPGIPDVVTQFLQRETTLQHVRQFRIVYQLKDSVVRRRDDIERRAEPARLFMNYRVVPSPWVEVSQYIQF